LSNFFAVFFGKIRLLNLFSSQIHNISFPVFSVKNLAATAKTAVKTPKNGIHDFSPQKQKFFI